MNKLLASDFGIWPMAKDAHVPGENMLREVDYWGRLVDYLLLYDQITIPTCDLQIVYILRKMLGDNVFEILIRDQTIKLARFDHWYGYVYSGTSGGIRAFQHNYSDPIKAKHFLSAFDPLEDTIEKSLMLPSNPHTTKERHNALKNILIDNIKALPTPKLIEDAKRESRRDFLDNPYLQSLYHLDGDPFGVNLDYNNNFNMCLYNAHKINSNKARTRKNKQSKQITGILNVMFENLQLGLSEYMDATTLVGDDSSLNIMRSKGQRYGFVEARKDAFIQMKKMHAIPDISQAFYSKRIEPHKLLELRNSEEGVYFRKWLAEGSKSEHEEEILARYRIALEEKHLLEKFPYKELRLVFLSAIDWESPVAEKIAGIADQYLPDRIKNRSPQLFMQKFKVISDEQKQS